MKRSNRYIELREKYDKGNEFEPREALELVKEMATANFDETVELSAELGIDPRKSDQMVRGSVVLPNGTGKERKVLALAEGELQVEAEEAGADWAGADEYIEKIEDGWLEFDAVVAAPEMMPKVGKLGRILGPRGLMPTPKNGTVTHDIGDAVEEIKKGKLSFKVDSGGIVHLPVGKASFELDKLHENLIQVIKKLWDLKPLSAKGRYIKGLTLSSTMSPGVKIDLIYVRNEIISRG